MKIQRWNMVKDGPDQECWMEVSIVGHYVLLVDHERTVDKLKKLLLKCKNDFDHGTFPQEEVDKALEEN